ncbi:MAG: hypothetical protein GF387_02470, partial [Candidatus Portnoybacteria bacterium]|nr:hypothetical protein [Candidatus Portnoybacteria bacterium]
MAKKKRGRPKKKKKKEKDKKEKKVYLNIHPETKRGVVTILFFTIAVLFILSFQGSGGFLGDFISKYSRVVFGVCLWLIPLGFISAGIIILRDIHKNVYLSTLLGIALFILSILALVNILSENGPESGGWLGYLISWPFLKLVGFSASLVVFGALLIISFLIAFNIP